MRLMRDPRRVLHAVLDATYETSSKLGEGSAVFLCHNKQHLTAIALPRSPIKIDLVCLV